MASIAAKSFVGTAIASAPKRACAQRSSVVTRAEGVTPSALTPGQAYTATLPGISAPFNSPYFDPAGFTVTAKPAEIKRWREAELTHGRVSMLAALGFLIGEQLEDFPLFDGAVKGPAITQFQQVEARGAIFWEPLVLVIGIAEAYRVALGWATPVGTGFNTLKDEYTNGDLGFDPLGLAPTDSAELSALKTKELNNGRLAMIGIAGFVAQELVQPNVEIFEHLFTGVETELVLEKADLVNAL